VQSIVTYANGMYSQLSKVSYAIWIFNFGYVWSGHSIHVNKDVRMRGYFSKPKGVRKQKRLRKSALLHYG